MAVQATGAAATAQPRSFAPGQVLGFRPAAIPLVCLLGLVYILASLPGLFGWLGTRDFTGRRFPAGGVLDFITGGLSSLSDWFQTLIGSSAPLVMTGLPLTAGWSAIPLLAVFALVLTLRNRSPRPFAATVLAFFAGLVMVPILAWIVQLVMWLIEGVGWFTSQLRHFFAWAWPVIKVVLMVGGGLLALAVLWLLIVGLSELVKAIGARDFALAVATLAATGGLVVLAVANPGARPIYVIGAIIAPLCCVAWLTRHLVPKVTWIVLAGAAGLIWLFAYLGWWAAIGSFFEMLLGAIGSFVGMLLGAVLQFLLIVLAVLFGFFLAAGLIVGVTGYFGTLLYLPLRDAPRAGAAQTNCINVAAGLGTLWSFLFTAASFSPELLDQVRNSIAAVPFVPDAQVIATGYGGLLPTAAKSTLATLLSSFNPTVDVVMLLIVGVIGILAVLFGRSSWKVDGFGQVWRPALVAVGLAVALAIPILVIGAYSNAAEDS